MKIPFEEWILSQEVSNDAKNLINEAIICYKADAYRAALLFSYLCFQTIVRDRMLNAHKPDNIPDGMWKDIHKNCVMKIHGIKLCLIIFSDNNQKKFFF